LPTAPLLYGEKSQARFDAVRLSWIGSVMRETAWAWWRRRSVVKTIEDARRHEIFSARPAGDRSRMFVRLVNDLTRHPAQGDPRYKGPARGVQAIEKGELDGLFMSGWSGPGRAYVRDRHGRGRVAPAGADVTAQGSLHAETPTILDLVSTPDARQIVQLVLDRMTLGRPSPRPPGIAATGSRCCAARSVWRSKTPSEARRGEAALRSMPPLARGRAW